MRKARRCILCVTAMLLTACAPRYVAAPVPVANEGSPSASAAPSPSPSAPAPPSAKPSPKPTRTLKKPVGTGGDIPKTATTKPTNDGVPTTGAGTFTVGPGGTAVVGTGTTLVKYRVELENGIAWGSIAPWTPASFAAAVDTIVAAPRGWTESGAHPITDSAEGMTNASWSFQRVSGSDYTVRVRLATPNTVDKLCGSVGVQTQGQYSCRYGSTILINLRRWLKGAPGFNIDLSGYHTMVIDHEMGHLLGFNHMKCPGAGKPAPVMQTQTIDLGGCVPNPYPFAADGTFIVGPWAPS